MSPALLFIESNTSGTGRLLASAARDLGLTPVLLSAEPARYEFAAQDGVVTVQVDTQNEASLPEECHRLSDRFTIRGVTSSSEYYVAAASRLARRLGLPGADAEAIELCRNKVRQIGVLSEAGLPVPVFRSAEGQMEAVQRARELALPVVLKPAEGSGSVGVRLCVDSAAVSEHAAVLCGRTRNERGLPVDPRILIQSFVAGPEYSIEVFDGATVGIARKYLGAPPWFVEEGHDFPAGVPASDQDRLASVAERAVSVLGLKWGAVHVEVRMGADGPRLIEVNPRLAGGFIPVLVRLATGSDLLRRMAEKAIGRNPSFEPTLHGYACIRFVVAHQEGIFRGLDGLEDALAEPAVCEAVAYRQSGTHLTPRGDFRDRVGHVIASAGNLREAQSAVERAHARIRVRADSEQQR